MKTVQINESVVINGKKYKRVEESLNPKVLAVAEEIRSCLMTADDLDNLDFDQKSISNGQEWKIVNGGVKMTLTLKAG